jgi:phosphatidylglycerophosphate synthase
MSEAGEARRPLKTRSAAWAQRLAAWLATTGVTPNQISMMSLVFALGGAALLVCYATPSGLVATAAMIQLRLLCNLIDGMVAIEGGKKSALGQIYNEMPDRVADAVLIVALGYAIAIPWLGWLGALAAVLTAYVRAFGGSLGLAQDFRGPMAKPHRMAVMTFACLIGAIEQATTGTMYALITAAVIVAAGSILTCITRTLAIARELQRAPR